MALLTQDEVLERLDEITPKGDEYTALCWLRWLYYMHAEGVIDLEDDRIYLHA